MGGEGADPTPIIAAMRGLHLTADLRGCAAARPVMTTPAVLRSTCLAAVAAAGLSAVGELFHRFKSGDAQDMARSIEYVFSHPAEVTEIVKRGQEVFREHSWQKERQRLIGVVSGLLEKGNKKTDFTKEASL